MIDRFSVRGTLPVIALSLLLGAVACSGAGEELATFKDGSVDRGTMRTLFEISGGPDAASRASVDAQYGLLQNYSYMILSAREARDAGMDKSEDLARVPNMFEEQAALEAFNVRLKRDSSSHKFTMAEYQFLFLGRGKPGDNARRPEAEELLGRLNNNMSDRDVEALIAERTERQRYKFLGGYMDPHCVSCQPDRLAFLSAPLEGKEQKTFVLAEDQSGFWLVREVSRDDVAGDDLKALFKDHHRKTMRIALRQVAQLPEKDQEQVRKRFVMDEKQIESMATNQAQAQVRREMGQAVQRRLETIRKEKNLEVKEVAQNQKAAEKPTDDTVLFTYEGGSYSYGDFKKAIGEGAAQEPFARQLGLLHGLLIPYILFDKFDSDFQDAKSSDLAEFLQTFRKNEQLARYYFSQKVREVEEPSAKEVKEWYDLRKESLYKGKSLGAVRATIVRQLTNTRRQEKAQAVQKELTDKYELKIFREKLKENEL
jgi:hypothetical protein